MADYDKQEEHDRTIDNYDEQAATQASSSKDGKGQIINTGGRRSKALTVKLLTSMLSKNSIELNLVKYELTDLHVLDSVHSRMSDVLFVDFSKNQLESIDWLNRLHQLKKINAQNNYIRNLNLSLAHLQEMDLRNNFIEKFPALNQLPMLRVLVLKANSISQFRLKLSSLNYQNLRKIDVRNNKIVMKQEQVSKLAEKLKKFQQLRLLNMEENSGIDLSGPAYINLIKSLPKSLDMFNNQRKIYLLKEVQDELLRQKKRQLELGKGQAEGEGDDDELPFNQEIPQEAAEEAQQEPKQLTDSARQRLEDQLQAYELDLDHEFREQNHKEESDYEEDQYGNETEEDNKEDEQEAEAKRQILLPTLKTMNFDLEQATHYPGKALLQLKKIYEQSEVVLKLQKTAPSREHFDAQFTVGYDNDEEVDDSQDQFLQYAQLLVDNNDELRDIMVSIISKLTVIHTRDFGVRCFHTLREMMLAEEEQRNLVRQYIHTNIIQQLIKLPVKDIPVGLLLGLKQLVDDPNLDEQSLLAPLFRDFFPMWLSEIKELIIFKTKRFSQEDRTEQINAILELITSALNGDESNVEYFVQTQLHDDVAHIFSRTNSNMSRYVPLLNCLSAVARMNQKAATDFIQQNIHLELIQDTKLTFYQYKKEQNFEAPTLEEERHMYMVFATQIELLASLINADVRARGKVLFDTTVYDLLLVVTFSRVEPVLLTAVCYLVNQVLTAINDKDFREASDFDVEFEMEKRIGRMQSCELILPFLGFTEGGEQSKFVQLMRKTQELHNTNDEVEELEINFDTVLETLDDPIIIGLFIQIVKIIEFFGREFAVLEAARVKSPNKKLEDRVEQKLHGIYDKVANKMNEAEREVALFNCLKIPSDLVRLAVIKTLFFVPVSQLDRSELSEILQMAERQQNVAAGQTELVLSILFQILSNIIKDNSREAKDTVDVFKNDFLERSIDISLNILFTNQSRRVFVVDEESEKSILSQSIINYFKFLSIDSFCHPILLNIFKRADALRTLLQLEQENTIHRSFWKTPVEVEATAGGSDLHDLKRVVAQGNAHLQPFNFMSFRVISQIANLLQYEKPKEMYIPNDMEMQVLCEELIDSSRNKFAERIKYENNFWHDYNRDRISQLQEQMDKAAAENHDNQHKMFTMTNGLKELLHFLTAQSNQVENFLRLNSDPAIAHAGTREKHFIFGRGLIYEMEKKIASYDREIKQVFVNVGNLEESKNSELSAAGKKKKKLNAKTKMLQSFMNSFIGAGYVPSDTDLYMAIRNRTHIEKKIAYRSRHEVGVQNDDLRAISVSAFMRCIYASIESAPEPKYFEQALANVRLDDIFRKVAELCSSTGWLQANIGTKYLQVMRYVIRMDHTARIEDHKNLLKYEILSIVVRRIVGILKKKITNENQNQEIKVDEQVVLCHVAIICNQMISQSTLFDWTNITQAAASVDMRDQGNDKESLSERQKREAMNSFLLTKLFPIDFVKTLTEAVFNELKMKEFRMHGLLPDIDHNSRQRLYFSAGDRLIEYTKKFLSQYIAFCSDNRYDVNHYIMSGFVLREQKQMRMSFMQEIMEGSNQLLVAQQELRTMNEAHSLSYQHYRDISAWIKEHGQAHRKTKTPLARKLMDQVKVDHYVGERIHLTMPMNVHIQSTTEPSNCMMIDKYMCLNVILTNHGVYLVDDENVSFFMDPTNLEKLPAPERVLSFNYKSIKRLIIGTRLEQRITIKVDVKVSDPWWNIQGGAFSNNSLDTSKRSTASPQKRKKKTAKLGPNGEELKELFFITFIVPGMVETLQMRELFEMAVDQSEFNAEEDEEEEQELSIIHYDMLVQMSIIERIMNFKSSELPDNKHCPLCEENRQRRDCKCDYHMAYGFLLGDNTTQLARLTKSTQRGGTVRLLSTDPLKQKQAMDAQASQLQQSVMTNTFSDSDYCIAAAISAATPTPTVTKNARPDIAKPDFGILVITTTDFWFFQEQPGRWQETFDGNSHYEKLLAQVVSGQMEGIGGLISPTVKVFSMSSIESIRIITSRIPAIELEYRVNGFIHTVAFSLMSDYQTQEALIAIKRLKKLGRQRDKEKRKHNQQAAQQTASYTPNNRMGNKSTKSSRRKSVISGLQAFTKEEMQNISKRASQISGRDNVLSKQSTRLVKQLNQSPKVMRN